jgi:hypothetical protein
MPERTHRMRDLIMTLESLCGPRWALRGERHNRNVSHLPATRHVAFGSKVVVGDAGGIFPKLCRLKIPELMTPPDPQSAQRVRPLIIQSRSTQNRKCIAAA